MAFWKSVTGDQDGMVLLQGYINRATGENGKSRNRCSHLLNFDSYRVPSQFCNERT